MTVNHARSNIVNYGNNKGIALVITLLVLALLMVIVLEFGSSMRVEARAAANFRDDIKAYYLAKSGVTFAIALLEEDKDNPDTKDVDSLNELWAQKIPPLPVGDGFVSVEISDERSKLNVNKIPTGFGTGIGIVTKDKMRDSAVRLFEQFDLKSDIVDAIADWIDTDDNDERIPGSERGYYEGSTEPYEAKNKSLDSIEELRLIKRVDDDTFTKLKNFLTVYTDGLLNLNTASKEVLMSLSDDMTKEIADEIISVRGENPYQQVKDISDKFTTNAFGEISRFLTVKSDYFSIVSSGEVNQNRKTIHAVVHRQQGKTTIDYWRVE